MKQENKSYSTATVECPKFKLLKCSGKEKHVNHLFKWTESSSRSEVFWEFIPDVVLNSFMLL